MSTQICTARRQIQREDVLGIDIPAQGIGIFVDIVQIVHARTPFVSRMEVFLAIFKIVLSHALQVRELSGNQTQMLGHKTEGALYFPAVQFRKFRPFCG
jgi:hypothetical protein